MLLNSMQTIASLITIASHRWLSWSPVDTNEKLYLYLYNYLYLYLYLSLYLSICIYI